MLSGRIMKGRNMESEVVVGLVVVTSEHRLDGNEGTAPRSFPGIKP